MEDSAKCERVNELKESKGTVKYENLDSDVSFKNG